MSTTRWDHALGFVCPECQALPGRPCRYLWPRGVDPDYVREHRHLLTAKQRMVIDLAGQETKRPHNGRMAELRRQLELDHHRQRHNEERHQRATWRAEARRRWKIARIQRDWDLAEYYQLRTWLAAHARLLTEQPKGKC